MKQFVAAALCCAVLASASGARAAAPKAPSAAAARFVETYPSVTLNGTAVSDGTLVLQHDGSTLVKLADLRAWNLVVPPAPIVVYRTDGYVALDTAPGIAATFDVATQTLALVAAPLAFTKQTVSLVERKRPAWQMARRDAGQFLTYDLSLGHGNVTGPASLGALLDIGAFDRRGRFESDFVATGGNGSRLSRENTWLALDRPERRAQIRIGDAISDGGTIGESLRFGGVQYATDFEYDPGFVSYPAPALHGTALVPSAVDLYVDGVLAARTHVGAGEFTLRDVPVLGSGGDVRLDVVDELGRHRSISANINPATDLLKAHLSRYSYDLGALRSTFGSRTNGYGPLYFAGTESYGLSDRVTGQGHLETSGANRVASLAGELALGTIGSLSLGAGASAVGGIRGSAQSFGFSAGRGGLAVGAQIVRRGTSYREIGDAYGTNASVALRGTSIAAHASVRTGRSGSMTVALIDQTRDLVGRVRLLSYSYTRNLHMASLQISAYRSTGATASTQFAVSLQRRTGTSHEETVGVNTTDGRVGPAIEYSDDELQPGSGSAYSVAVERSDTSSPYVHGDYQRHFNAFALSTSYDASGGAYEANASLSGSLLHMGKAFIPTQELGDSFAVVEVPKMAGVHVAANGQVSSVTDKHGIAALPFLAAYRPNTISIDANDLPLALENATTSSVVVPARHGGVLVTFDAAPDGALTLALVDDRGNPLPPGATIRATGPERSWPIGENGAAYLSPVVSGALHLTVDVPGKDACYADVVVPHALAGIPNLGSVTCSALARTSQNAAPAAGGNR